MQIEEFQSSFAKSIKRTTSILIHYWKDCIDTLEQPTKSRPTIILSNQN